ncbi:MAG: MoaD/ThiS family protein [Candidatus Bathyarchaeia archaeon]
MRVKLQYLGLVKNRLGKKEEEMDLKEGAFLSELLNKLTEIYGENLKTLLGSDKESRLDPSIVITVNGISRTTDLRLHEGDRVAIMTLISGG